MLGTSQAEKKESLRRWLGEVLTCQFSAIERVFLERAPMLIVSGNSAGVGQGKKTATR